MPINKVKRHFQVKETKSAELMVSGFTLLWGVWFGTLHTGTILALSKVIDAVGQVGGSVVWCCAFVVIGIFQFLGVTYHYPQWRNIAARLGMLIWSTSGVAFLHADLRLFSWVICFYMAFCCFMIQLHRTAGMAAVELELGKLEAHA